MLKYFRYECNLCLKLCSDILSSDCCSTPVCLKCSLDLAEHYKNRGTVISCIFCNIKVSSTYTIRDATQVEKKDFEKKCKESMKLLESKKKSVKKEGDEESNNNSRVSIAVDLQNISSFQSPEKVNNLDSNVKPKRLDFFEDKNLPKTSFSSFRANINNQNDSYLLVPNNIFDDLLTSNPSSPNADLQASSNSKNLSTKYTSTMMNIENEISNNAINSSIKKKDKKVKQITKNIEARKNNNRKKSS